MKYQVLGCAAVLFTALGCGAGAEEEGEDLGQSQSALLVTSKVLRMNQSGKCVEYNGFGHFKTIDCTSPYPNSKKWNFDGDTTTGFRVRNNASQCIVAPTTFWNGIPLNMISSCSANGYTKWKILPGSGSLGENTFQLQNVQTGLCMKEDLTASGPMLRLSTCATTWPAIGDQRLLLDSF